MQKFYAQINNNGKVEALLETEKQMVEMATFDQRVLGTTYNNGQFVGVKSVLTVDKTTINADDVDTATITINIFNWDDTVSTMNGTINIVINNARKTLIVTNGTATYSFKTTTGGVYNIKTQDTEANKYINHGSVNVEAYAPL